MILWLCGYIYSDKEKLVVFLSHCFHKMTACDKEVARVLNRVQWLLEIMGHVRNIVTQTIPLSNSTADLSQVMSIAKKGMDRIKQGSCSCFIRLQ